ncbi:MAG: Vitamin B12-binding protein [bacterium]|nr:Vitamin B12-binding protein [bacterium]
MSLVPSLTESLAELGAAGSLAGVTDWCWYPTEVVAPLPKVGGTKTPHLDRIRDLQPDLILVNEEENRREDVEALAADFPCLVTFPRTVADNIDLVSLLGAITGEDATAAEWTSRMRSLEAEVRATMQQRAARSLAYLIWRKPYMTINRDTYVHSVLELLHCANPWGNATDRYPAITVDELESEDPDMVCLSSEPFPFEEKHVAEYEALLPGSRAVQQGQVFVDDGTLYCWYGTRWVRALEHFLKSPHYA